MQYSRASALLSRLGYSGDSFALLGEVDNDTPYKAVFESSEAVLPLRNIPPDLRVDVALVVVRHGDKLADLGPVLARFRDVHAERLLLVARRGVYGIADLVALGFEVQESSSDDELICTWDPAIANRPREWNDARNWANPENFSKFRW